MTWDRIERALVGATQFSLAPVVRLSIVALLVAFSVSGSALLYSKATAPPFVCSFATAGVGRDVAGASVGTAGAAAAATSVGARIDHTVTLKPAGLSSVIRLGGGSTCPTPNLLTGQTTHKKKGANFQTHSVSPPSPTMLQTLFDQTRAKMQTINGGVSMSPLGFFRDDPERILVLNPPAPNNCIVRRVTDKSALERFLVTDPAINIYLIGDLDAVYWDDCVWDALCNAPMPDKGSSRGKVGNVEDGNGDDDGGGDGEIEAVALTYTGLTVPSMQILASVGFAHV